MRANNGNITAGAISASASELAAPVFTQLLGKTHADQLNSDERQTVIALSSLVGALTAGLDAQQTGSGNNTVGILNAAALGSEIGKRAVENNYLSKQEEDEIFNIVNKFDKKGSLSSYAQERAWYLLSKDAEIDRLIQLHQKNPNALTANQKAYLYHEVKLIANSYPNLSVSDIFKHRLFGKYG
ncbi:VENN motif pre-toxin domain-containing protein [Avibacterium paragallinarum]|uniref:VENN motif pre-toxin domain-containing protein n=2 Tax=Avibacterium paragallinarum TaxID=728 RepID=A0ABU7QG02_AVIPA|nr:VENN motif pre-toxin domain-containing protein [Avibacterium paragallinarum]MEE3607474.1 VENN motif pre-toxin domain-containing protein [Avibacterium paragallinarum]MEE3682034.1 VENN motif pre-toxin domain-containing protein [Avibacterium paragallinarum]MEE4386771.1 VENN motif pre-toxin domain-containing protein [Avibacterium paragallinarum]QZP14992.1 VENN motif pre-toxin domain-containing protein [Avibacterium paragallinarum]WAL57468.1 VENN motif pre-toxin domain-containing protein [Avibac